LKMGRTAHGFRRCERTSSVQTMRPMPPDSLWAGPRSAPPEQEPEASPVPVPVRVREEEASRWDWAMVIAGVIASLLLLLGLAVIVALIAT
jgi:hypothetical protein